MIIVPNNEESLRELDPNIFDRLLHCSVSFVHHFDLTIPFLLHVRKYTWMCLKESSTLLKHKLFDRDRAGVCKSLVLLSRDVSKMARVRVVSRKRGAGWWMVVDGGCSTDGVTQCTDCCTHAPGHHSTTSRSQELVTTLACRMPARRG